MKTKKQDAMTMPPMKKRKKGEDALTALTRKK